MTHDELVDIAIVKDLHKLIRKQMKAINAVFELHRVSDVGLFCDGCARFVEPYPCPTIQTLEKELQ